MPVSAQVTITSAARTQLSSHGVNFKWLLFQNNSTDNMRVGDVTIVAGVYGTGKGILLTPGGGNFTGATPIQNGILSNWYVAGTAADVLDITYEPA